jgi:hypothetical protein
MSDTYLGFKEEEIKPLISSMGFSIVSNKIVEEGMKIGFMYREKPFDKNDSGWRFLSGTETQEYTDDESNSKIIDVNVMANYDPEIIPFLTMPFGTDVEKDEVSNKYVLINGE